MSSSDPRTPDQPSEQESSEDAYLDDEEADSFPASDPHSDWAGPHNA